MAVYYSIKCPHCGKIIESGKDRTEQYGSPFRKCQHCRQGYVDTNYIEPALLSEKELYGKKFNWPAILYIIFGAFFLYGFFYSSRIFFAVIGVAAFVFGAASIVSTMKYKPKEDKELAQKLKESQQRLSDPHYVIALRNAGYGINTELLTWAKNAVTQEQE